MRKILFFLLFLPFPAGAQRDKLRPLFFPAERNGVQVLSQRFEYALMDADKLRIGDVVIDSAKLRFRLERTPEGERLAFTWPAGLLTDGEIALLNNNGKALWTASFTKEDLRVQADAADAEDLRTDQAHYVSQPIPAELIRELKFLPFMTFCIFRNGEDTRISACSQDLFIHSDAGGDDVRSRSVKREAFVEINGKPVTNQGLIYLNSADEDLIIHAKAESGAAIEITTRRNDIDFRDVTAPKDGKRIVVRTRGAEPARKKNAKDLGDGEYEVSLPRERPSYYILGDGGIPMRQEFFVKGELPSEDLRPFLHPAAPLRTYASSVDWLGIRPERIKVAADSENDRIEDLPKNRFLWHLRDLEPGANRRLLKVESERGVFFAAGDIERALPNVLGADLAFTAPDAIAAGRLSYDRWLENLLGGRLRWGFGLAYEKSLNKKDTVPEASAATLALRYRFSGGFVFRDPSSGLGLLATQLKLGETSFTALGLEAFSQIRLEGGGGFRRRFPWWNAFVRYWPAASAADDVKLAAYWKAGLEAMTPLRPGSYLKSGLALSQAKVQEQTDGGQAQAELAFGYVRNF